MTDNRMIIATVVGTGIAMTTVIVAFIGIVAGGINSRIDDVNANVNNRIGDLNASIDSRFNNLNASIDSRFNDLNASIDSRFNDLNASIDRRFDAVNRRIDDLQQEMRELRALVIDAIKGADAADE